MADRSRVDGVILPGAAATPRTAILAACRHAADAIREAIRDHGPISFAEFMELALYGPGGFYERPAGRRARATSSRARTSTRSSASCSAGRSRSSGRRSATPQPFRIAEVGAGDGTLATQLLGAPGADGLVYTAVERSAGARDALAAIDGITLGETLVATGGGPHLVLAHELLDNLPFRRVRRTPDGPREVRVGSIGDRLVEVLADPGPDADRRAPRPGSSPTRGRRARRRARLRRRRRRRADARLRAPDRLRGPRLERRPGARLSRPPRGRGPARHARRGRHHRRRGLLGDRAARRARLDSRRSRSSRSTAR